MRNAKPIDNGPSRITALTLEQYHRQGVRLVPEPARGTRGHFVRPTGQEWRDQAACAGKGAWLFFVDCDCSVCNAWGRREKIVDGSPSARALALCDACPVREECLTDALQYTSFEDHGIRGGMTAKARAAIRRTDRPTGFVKACVICGEQFRTGRSRQVCCTPKCKRRWDQQLVRMNPERARARRVARRLRAQEIASAGSENVSKRDGTGPADRSPSHPQGRTGTVG